MSGTIEEFDDDTDFALPVTTVASGGANGGNDDHARMAQMQELMKGMQTGEGSGMMGGSRVDETLSAEAKRWISVYPIYFDAKRRYMKGCRRVAHDHSCLWPKSESIQSAAARLTLMHAHEPQKTHPQDWENPGRVKIQLFDDNGKPKNKNLESKKALLNAIASLIQPQCGGKPPPLVKKKVNTEQTARPKVGEKPCSPVNNKNAASRTKKGRRVSEKVKAEDRIKGSRPPPLSARYSVNSPAIEVGMLNADMGGMMGGLQGMGPLGAMMGQMGMGGDDDDDDGADAEAERLKEEEERKKKKDPMQQLSRRQKKRVVRIGR